MITACQRCGTLGQLRTVGLLELCTQCVLQASCAPFHHEYAGTMDPGHWVCRQCGSFLHSQPLSTEPVTVPWYPGRT